MKNFVDYKWLKDNLDNEKLLVFDARAGLSNVLEGINAYNQGHIKNAQFVSLEEVMTGKKSTHGGRHPLPHIDKFTEDMKKFGMEDDSIVVIYDDGNLAMAGRLWWILKYFGKKDIFVLEGGIKKWIDMGESITTEIPKINRSKTLSLKKNDGIKVDMDYVKNSIFRDNTAIIDARAHERYTGKTEPLDRIAGHIPSALNYPWTELVKDGQIKSINKLKETFSDLEKYDEIIVHCGSGITATVNILLMEEIGLSPKLYPGGYSDWVSYEDNEVVKE